MKLHQLNRSSIGDNSFSVSHNLYKNFLKVWHFHEEYELVLILRSSGTRFVGDSIERFGQNDLVLIGKNMPHMWLNDQEYFDKDSVLEAEAVSIHFQREFLGEMFFEIPEMRAIASILDLSAQGIRFTDIPFDLIQNLKDLREFNATHRIIKFLEILDQLSRLNSYHLLSSVGFVNSYHKSENKRLKSTYEFIFKNFNKPINSGDIAEAVSMNKSAFSRFFKKVHRKPVTKYLNEIRIGYACKLLIEENESITSIAYLSGFNNISNFNRQFKAVKGKSPSEFLKKHKGID